MTNDEILKYTLELVNKARVAIGKQPINEMPCGNQEDSESCPVAIGFDYFRIIEAYSDYLEISLPYEQLATAISDAWGTTKLRYRTVSGRIVWKVFYTPEIACFIYIFDRGEFPDLVAHPFEEEEETEA